MNPRIGFFTTAGAFLSFCLAFGFCFGAYAQTAETPSLAWISKAARILRYGKTLGPTDPTHELQNMSQDQVLDWLMRDPAFMDAVADFEMYFFGIQEAPLFTIDANGNRVYAYHLLESPSIFMSALETYKDGDFFKMLDLQPEIPFGVNQNPDKTYDIFRFSEEKQNPISGDLPWAEQRRRVLEFYINRYKKFLTWLDANPNAILSEKCTHHGQMIYNDIPQLFYLRIFHGSPLLASDSYYFQSDLYSYCNSDKPGYVKDFREKVAEEIARAEKIVAFLEQFDPPAYSIKKLSDVRWLSREQLGYFSVVNSFGSTLFGVKEMGQDFFSSTNYGRKRAKRVLSRYFCDDLTPIAFVQPREHTGNRHASEQSCYACHYKLDPMAGFFRNQRALLFDGSLKDSFYFSDGVLANRIEFEKFWKSDSPNREWDVGYVRSATQESKNDYASTIPELLKMIQKAPEVKACIVKRMGEYFLGPKVLLSAGYLQELTDHFLQESKENSAIAFKKTIKRLLKSKTFATRNPSPDQCYDFGKNEDPEHQPPCKVAEILRQNCTLCHNPLQTAAGLDLSRWIKNQDGQLSFPHVQPSDGKVVSKIETLQSIIDRISTADLNRQMPLGKEMSNSQRETLFIWANAEIAGATKYEGAKFQ